MAKELTPISPELQKNIDAIQAFKKQVDEIGNNCLQIKIVDDATLAVGQQNLAKANNLAKSIEEKRKLVKQPYLDAGKLIDDTCKDIVKQLEAGMAHIKSGVAGYEKKRLEEQKRKDAIVERINGKTTQGLKNLYEKANSVKECDEALKRIEEGFPKAEAFEEFAEMAFKLRDSYIELIKLKKEQFLSGDIPEEIMDQALEEAAKVQEEAVHVKQEVAADTATNKTKNIRYNWSFELVDIAKVPQEWLTIDEAKIKDWMKVNKDSLKEEELNGVRFFKQMIVTA